MKAAVVHQRGEVPQYTDFPDPVAQNNNELIITMKAAAVKHLDKARASGKHYSTHGTPHQPHVVGGDGIGILPDCTRVYTMGGRGMIAEKAIAEKDRMVPVPDGVDDATAAALPNAVIGSAMGLRFKARIQPGDTVFINGATSFTGKIAVQIAKHYGAGKIIATGRNKQSLQELLTLGADEIISINQTDDAFVAQLKQIHSQTPFDVMLDYLWGHTAEMIFSILKGNGMFSHKTRYVSVGAITGDVITMSSQLLRSVDLQLSGSGLGSWTKDEVKQLFTTILPEMFQLAANKKLVADTITVGLPDIGKLWDMEISGGKRLVVTI